MNFPEWAQLILTVLGSAASGFLGAVAMFWRWVAKIKKADDERMRGLETRVDMLELAVGSEVKGGGLYSRIAELKTQLIGMEVKAEERHEFLRTRLHDNNAQVQTVLSKVQQETMNRLDALRKDVQTDMDRLQDQLPDRRGKSR